jgi:hypothetical protein
VTDFDAFERVLVIGDFDCEVVSDPQIMMKVAVDLYGPVNHLADEFNFLAEPLGAPGERSRIRHVTLPHKVVYVFAIVCNDVFRVYQTRHLLIGLLSKIKLINILRIRIIRRIQ